MSESLVVTYLARVDRLAATLPAAQRAELLSQLEQHLREALASGTAHDEPSTRRILNQLGTPEAIMAEARASAIPSGGELYDVPLRAFRWLTLGSFIPLAGWLVGVGLVWSSPLWSARQRLWALLFPGGVLGALVCCAWLAAESGSTCGSGAGGPTSGLGGPALSSVSTARSCVDTGAVPPALGLVLFLLVIVAAAVGPVILLRTGRANLARRLDSETLEPVA